MNTLIQTGIGESMPIELSDECTPDTTATFNASEIYVLSWNETTAQASITASVAGLYHIYDYSIAESGSSQQNESAYLRIYNTTNPSGTPEYSNCNDDWIVSDPDNNGALPQGTRIYMGTFWLDAGSNTLELNHYCPLFRSGECTSFHNNNTSCNDTNVNSVHYTGEGLCLESGD